jgi:thiol-disulfide isomerase/thioredoxin
MEDVLTSKYAGKVNAPRFPVRAEWLNSSGPLSLEDFKGKLLVLDFWSYCCINCMHIIPVLRRLERKYPEEIAVVGVHSAKFDEERATEHIQQAIMRYGVSHPVINDADKVVWQSYAVRAWPTLIFVDPTGKVVGRIEGELTYEDGVTLFDEMLAEFREAGTLRPSPGHYAEPALRVGVLDYPGKIVADEENERLFIADTGHNRILVTDLEGEIQTVIGSGHEGLADGVLEGAQFNHPQGIAVYGETLFVADTENHALRVVDLEMGTVETIAGTGNQAVGHVEGGLGLEVDLRSPWDIALAGRSLHIAMAGSHQIWTMNLDTHIVQATVGTGAENIVDGPPEEALLAQPSGITVDEDYVMYVADSESSSIRAVDAVSAHHVSTLVGAGLFDFGDADGGALVARLQHPLGIDYDGGTVFIADTYNHKIKRLGTDSLMVSTLAGSGEPGHDDGPSARATFYEPGGLSMGGSTIYVADTNNHAVRAIDLDTAMVRTLTVDF